MNYRKLLNDSILKNELKTPNARLLLIFFERADIIARDVFYNNFELLLLLIIPPWF